MDNVETLALQRNQHYHQHIHCGSYLFYFHLIYLILFFARDHKERHTFLFCITVIYYIYTCIYEYRKGYTYKIYLQHMCVCENNLHLKPKYY